MDAADIESWKGRTFIAEDVLSERLVAGFRATLEPCLVAVEEGCAPFGSHWCLFPTEEPMTGLGNDGHPKLYPHLPPPPLPRRMWAGGRLECLAPLRVGDKVRRTTRLADMQHKEGRSGDLWFVTVGHDYATERGVAIRERQDIVYRAPAETQPAPAARTGEDPPEPGLPLVWCVATPPTLLFRYSAITFNAHRIHYDMPYATQAEGYAGLVVHGPLQATLLLNAAVKASGASRCTFDYRGRTPAIAGPDLDICADITGARVHTRTDAGIHMEGRFRPEMAGDNT